MPFVMSVFRLTPVAIVANITVCTMIAGQQELQVLVPVPPAIAPPKQVDENHHEDDRLQRHVEQLFRGAPRS